MNVTFTPSSNNTNVCNILDILKTLVVGVLAPQSLSTDIDAQLVCKFDAH